MIAVAANAVPPSAFVTNAPAGYTVLEDYLQWLAIPHALVTNSTLDVDLRRFTGGGAVYLDHGRQDRAGRFHAGRVDAGPDGGGQGFGHRSQVLVLP